MPSSNGLVTAVWPFSLQVQHFRIILSSLCFLSSSLSRSFCVSIFWGFHSLHWWKKLYDFYAHFDQHLHTHSINNVIWFCCKTKMCVHTLVWLSEVNRKLVVWTRYNYGVHSLYTIRSTSNDSNGALLHESVISMYLLLRISYHHEFAMVCVCVFFWYTSKLASPIRVASTVNINCTVLNSFINMK